ncbi:hypothetical protein ANN_19967 [Periplaneta americana]|uniref:Uncharacterized protein n=1 Tax=Periplaneta americana TaxID=6978 RepID=A0ABQ8SCD4_PERAM|nr:hypothetical protein ANN_19967 [Periplaneta americana]
MKRLIQYEKARARKPVLCTGVRLDFAAAEGLSSSAVDRSWRDLSSSAVDRSWRDEFEYSELSLKDAQIFSRAQYRTANTECINSPIFTVHVSDNYAGVGKITDLNANLFENFFFYVFYAYLVNMFRPIFGHLRNWSLLVLAPFVSYVTKTNNDQFRRDEHIVKHCASVVDFRRPAIVKAMMDALCNRHSAMLALRSTRIGPIHQINYGLFNDARNCRGYISVVGVSEFCPAGVLLHASKSTDMSLSHLNTLKCHRPGPGSNPQPRLQKARAMSDT